MRQPAKRFLFNALVLLGAAAATAASEVTLTLIQFPEKRSIDVPFRANASAPQNATLTGDVEARGSQTEIELDFKNLQPALLFGGRITSYVLWAATRDGAVHNLGEIPPTRATGNAKFQTGLKEFGMFVTAEPIPGIWRPSDMVVFVSGPSTNKYGKSIPHSVSVLAPASPHDRESIGAARYDASEPIELAQARRVYATGVELGVDKYDPKSMTEAATTLAQATNSIKSGGSSKAVVDYSHRTVSLVSSAASRMVKDLEEKKIADAAARRKAEMDTLAGKATAAEAAAAAEATARAEADVSRRQAEEAAGRAEELRVRAESEKDAAERAKAESAAAAAALAAQKSDLEAQMAALVVEKNAIAADREKVQGERDAMAERLSGALAKVADTTKTARGLVVNLPDILFDTGKSTLKTGAMVTLAKLAGVVSLYPDLNLRIEGHTDSTGSQEVNAKLSKARALAVLDFLKEQGTPVARMQYDGYADKFPVAGNETKEGRARNRRVEVVLAEGTIQPPG
jgi:outer membrane protein OmpA-like peptidoglycan-associated protein